jgi:hypothetical protein
VQALAARVRILAPVPVPLALDLPVHADDGPVQVYVGAAQPQGLVLPEAERERDRPPGAVPASRREAQQRAGLGGGQRLAFRILGLWRVDQRARVPGDQLFAYRYGQGPGQDAVNLDDSVRGQPFAAQ